MKGATSGSLEEFKDHQAADSGSSEGMSFQYSAEHAKKQTGNIGIKCTNPSMYNVEKWPNML